jgi:hypothetical protein
VTIVRGGGGGGGGIDGGRWSFNVAGIRSRWFLGHHRVVLVSDCIL